METTKPKSSKKKTFLIIGAVVLGMAAIGSLSEDKEAGTAKAEVVAESKPDALTMMESVFVGEHSKEAIKEKLDKLLSTYKMEVSEENYNAVGSALLSLRKSSKNNIPEMELADCVINSYTDQAPLKFTEAAGICAVLLEGGN